MSGKTGQKAPAKSVPTPEIHEQGDHNDKGGTFTRHLQETAMHDLPLKPPIPDLKNVFIHIFDSGTENAARAQMARALKAVDDIIDEFLSHSQFDAAHDVVRAFEEEFDRVHEDLVNLGFGESWVHYLDAIRKEFPERAKTRIEKD